MSPKTFVNRTVLESASVVAALALVALVVASGPVAVGVLAGGAVAVANLWWLARRALAATTPGAPHWSLGSVVRLAAVAGLVGAVLASGAAHPVGLVVGLTVLPFVVITRGLAAAREG
jgi:hypothetical protein